MSELRKDYRYDKPYRVTESVNPAFSDATKVRYEYDSITGDSLKTTTLVDLFNNGKYPSGI